MWLQKEISLKPRARGFHLITEELLRELPALRDFKIGIMNLFILHTSASLTINENADPAVRQDFESFFNHAVPDTPPVFCR
jgi:secondary thiamine-phosphate synthase enzyme